MALRLVSLWQRACANARNFRLYYPYWQYTNLFIFRFVSLLYLYTAHYIYYVKTAVSKELSFIEKYYLNILVIFFIEYFTFWLDCVVFTCIYNIFIEQFRRCFNLEFLNSFLKSCVTKTNNVKIKKNDSVRNMLLNIFRLQKLTKLPMMLINASESLQVGRFNSQNSETLMLHVKRFVFIFEKVVWSVRYRKRN